METLKRQYIIFETIEKMKTNFKKDSAERKTADYIEKRLSTLEALWDEFKSKDEELKQTEHKGISTEDYSKLADQTKNLYVTFKTLLQTCVITTLEDKGMPSKADELFSQQTTNFRAFTRMVKSLNIEQLSEKWEIEDKVQMLQSRWKAIDEVHWKLDNIFIGADVDYEQEYTQHEVVYESTKKQLYQKLNSVVHRHDTLPKVEIPTFSGSYSQWPTFLDLFSEAIHNNKMITKAQKMQHLKGKLRGEAERIVQHLSVTADNYDTCWDLLNHRYNNLQLLFTKQMQIFLNQPSVQQQTAFELKRLHDTSLEVVHAIHNLGVDTSTWDPFLVHILTSKLDSDTYTSYMETRKKPRDLPVFDEFIEFLEGKFTALEPIIKRKQTTSQLNKTSPGQARDSPSTSHNDGHNNGKFKRFVAKSFHANTERNCPICKTNHILLYCKTFQNMNPNVKKATISQLNICENCLFSHNGKQCTSIKRCRVCNSAHHTSLHDLLRDTARVQPATSSTTTYEQHDTVDKQRKSNNHVAENYNEVLLATIQMKVRTADGTYIQLRCLLDQGSQINLITESAAQRLGLPRHNQNATVSGIGLTANQSNGTVRLICQSIYGDHEFTTDALVMTKMINNLPNYSFEKQYWPHLANINLADPDYNISRPIDALLDAGVYAEIIMDGLLRGPIQAPLAQQTKMGWVLLGNIKTFNCHAVLNNLDDIAQFWEIEEITEPSRNQTPVEEYCETLYKTTTRRLHNGRYEVKLPMQPNFEENLGASKPQAVAQLLQLEKRLAKNEELANSYKNFMNEYIKLGHMKLCTVPQEPSCFLPHHGVIKLDSTTTRLRTVFNASSPTRSGKSLNQLMESGPNLQQDLQAIILRWRSYRYVYSADIEKFYTLLAQIESCLNSRPLTPLTEDIDDLEYLTPGHFLIGSPLLAGPLSPEQEPRNIRTRWQLTEKLHKDFWKRWSAEYLQSLQGRSKWNSVKKNLKIGDMVLVKEDNIPPARWLLGRVTETHPGKDGHVRVVTLKTKTNILKRPITKLSPLPIDATEKNTEAPSTKAQAPSNQQKQTPSRRANKPSFNSCTCLFFLFLASCASAFTQQTNAVELSPKKLIYFDKLSDMQIIQDQWKLVVYYNMTTYWEGMKGVEGYVNHLTDLCSRDTTYFSIAAQLQHEMRELKHYNDILTTDHGLRNKRSKRGLIDGVGYIANSLFGVLDQRFAQQYDKDIQLLQNNQHHLLKLFKNHTSIIEGEYNLLKRNEQVMNQQFEAINRHLAEQDQRITADHQESINNMYITATALTANMIMGNLRRLQQMLLDLVTDVKDGRINMHLLKPEQFEEQLNIIAGQLPGELTLPCVNTRYCTRDMYKLSRVHVHLTNNFALFEFKLPLVNTEQYELNRIIPIPHISSGTTQRTVVTSEYLAVNLKKDAVIPLSHQDITSCLEVKEHHLICPMTLPIYDTKSSGNICEAQLINNKNISACKTITTECADKWIRLHIPGAWLFACCQECAMRTFCPAGVSPLSLRGTGIVTLLFGCMIKGDNVVIQSHNNFHSEMTIREDSLYIPESSLNRVIVEKNYTFNIVTESHQETLNKLRTSIDTVKVQQETLQNIASSHETHHYTFISFIVICTSAVSTWAVIYIRRRLRNTAAQDIAQNQEPKVNDVTFRHLRPSQDIDSVSDVIVHAPKRIDKATAP